jgi:hypothetical protein
LLTKANSGIQFNNIDPEIDTFLKIIVLLYADDTILVSDDPQKLQSCLDDFVEYCSIWHLNINISKTKAIVFGTRNDRNFSFKINNTPIQIVKSYKYLGTQFSKSGNFLTPRTHLVQQAKKAMYLVYKKNK